MVGRTVFAVDGHDVRDLLDIEQCGHAREEVLAKRAVADDDVGVAALLDVLDEQRCPVLGEAAVVGFIVDHDHLLESIDFCGFFCDAFDVLAGEEAMDAAAELLTGCDGT